jgi:hypothetical protein
MYIGVDNLREKLENEKNITIAHFEEEFGALNKEVRKLKNVIAAKEKSGVKQPASPMKKIRTDYYNRAIQLLKKMVSNNPYSPEGKEANYNACKLISEMEEYNTKNDS